MKVSLYVREQSTRKYTKATKRSYPLGTIFVLRYKGTWETIEALTVQEAHQKRAAKELAVLSGWRKKKPTPTVLMLDAAMDSYLSEIKAGRKPKTYQAYDTALRYFHECVGNKPIKDITRGDLIVFAAFLRDEKEQAPRSCWNKFSNVMSFLKHHDAKPKIKPHDWPQYVEEEPEMYEQETLDKFFAACDDDERLLFEFFQMTGMREQEVIYATDKCLDFSNCTVSVKHNPEYGWTPKMYRERTIPVPRSLMSKLKAMLVKRGKGGLLFPTNTGHPKFNFLDIAKAIARRAGIDESEVWLHKFRSTFATRSLWSGMDLRTVQSWMGHTDLASTMRYLKPNRAVVQEKVEAIWS